MTRRLISAAAFLVGFALVVAGAGPITGLFSEGASGFAVQALLPCGEGNAATVAAIAQLAPGTTVSGANVGVARSGIADDVVVLYPRDRGAVSGAALQTTGGGVLRTGNIVGQAADPQYRSCHYRLADSPAASAIAQRATEKMIESSLLSRDQLADPGTTFMLTDDPLDQGKLLFAVVIPQPQVSASAKNVVVAVVARGSSQVLSVAPGDWYANCVDNKDCAD